MPGPVALTDSTADRLKARLGEVPGEIGTRSRGAGGSRFVLVRCTDGEPADVSGVGAECYPGVIVRPSATLAAADQVDGGEVWLSLFAGAEATAPVGGGVYSCQLAGPVDIAGDVRPRAFGGAMAEDRQFVYPSDLSWTSTQGFGGGASSGAVVTLPAGTWLLIIPYLVRVEYSLANNLHSPLVSYDWCPTGTGSWTGANALSYPARDRNVSYQSGVGMSSEFGWGGTLVHVMTFAEEVDLRISASAEVSSPGGSGTADYRCEFAYLLAYKLAGAPAPLAGGGFTGTVP